jgi:hypothetical protein
LPRNRNLRVHLELDENRWRFTLHKDSQAHCSARGYDSPVTAVQEAMVLLSCLRLAADRAKRKAEQPTESVRQPDQ